MKAKEVPGMHQALKDLESYFLMFYSTFESSLYKGKSYFDEEDVPLDAHLHANLVRYWARLRLREHNLDAEFESEELNNCGIQLNIKPWFIRIRKSARGAMPHPGRSKQLQRFYQQKLSPEFAELHNLLLLWHATPAGDFKGLSLVYPLSEHAFKWQAEIPHPATSADTKTTYQLSFDETDYIETIGDVGDLEIEPLGDLEIEPLEEQENQDTGTESL